MGRHAAAALLAAALAATLAGSPAQQTGHDAAGAGASPHEKAGMSKLDYDLMDAVSEGETHEVQRLLADGANVNALNTEGETPLHVSGIYGAVEPLRLLLKAGAKVNVQATGAKSLGLAPLHWFVHGGHKEGTGELLKAGANVNMIVHDEAGDELTALDIARRYAGSGSDRHTAIAALLTGAGGMERDKLPGGKKAEL